MHNFHRGRIASRVMQDCIKLIIFNPSCQTEQDHFQLKAFLSHGMDRFGQKPLNLTPGRFDYFAVMRCQIRSPGGMRAKGIRLSYRNQMQIGFCEYIFDFIAVVRLISKDTTGLWQIEIETLKPRNVSKASGSYSFTVERKSKTRERATYSFTVERKSYPRERVTRTP